MTTSILLPGSEVEATLHDWRAAARLLDHTLLHPDASAAEVEQACQAAIFYGFACVVVHPTRLAQAVALLHGTPVRPCAPVGYSTGATLVSVKRFEAAELLKLGARELDVVMNVSALKSGERALVANEMKSLVGMGHDAGAVVKIILETSLLTMEEKLLASQLALEAHADFVKTSTGLSGGATVDDVILLRGVVGQRAGVKASGGIRGAEQMAAMLAAGANRIGSSASIEIMRELGAPGLKET